ncbi:MAG TPA: hypothetical protein VIN56_08200, partial [Candidatus Dormibacteraeota bacterium]
PQAGFGHMYSRSLRVIPSQVDPHPEQRLVLAKNRGATSNRLPLARHLYSSCRRTVTSPK